MIYIILGATKRTNRLIWIEQRFYQTYDAITNGGAIKIVCTVDRCSIKPTKPDTSVDLTRLNFKVILFQRKAGNTSCNSNPRDTCKRRIFFFSIKPVPFFSYHLFSLANISECPRFVTAIKLPGVSLISFEQLDLCLIRPAHGAAIFTTSRQLAKFIAVPEIRRSFFSRLSCCVREEWACGKLRAHLEGFKSI